MSTFTLSAPPTLFTVTRPAFTNEQSRNRVQFQGSCTDGTMFVVWDKFTVTLADEKKGVLKGLQKGDVVEVKGKWSTWINKKSATHRTSFLLTSVAGKDRAPEGEDEFPVEKEFNFEESDSSLMLKKLNIEKEIERLEKRAEGRSEDVANFIKRGKCDDGGYYENYEQGSIGSNSRFRSAESAVQNGKSNSPTAGAVPAVQTGKKTKFNESGEEVGGAANEAKAGGAANNGDQDMDL